jgi:hypothetical protein
MMILAGGVCGGELSRQGRLERRSDAFRAKCRQQRPAARSTLTHWYAGPLQLCGCSLCQVVLERYGRRIPRGLIRLQILKDHPGARYVQRECCVAWRRWGWSPWAEKSNVISHSGSSMALTFHNSRV